jgi:hypothetical protein
LLFMDCLVGKHEARLCRLCNSFCKNKPIKWLILSL